MNHYLSVFIEALWNASIIPGASETTLAAMRAFGEQQMLVPTILAIIGGFLGQTFNWLAGAFIVFLHRKNTFSLSPEAYEKARAFFQRYLTWLMTLCWLPMMNFLAFAAGFLGVRARIALPLLLAGTVFHYLYETKVLW
jgi:membrane protein YqaA with SNARE-associated domain